MAEPTVRFQPSSSETEALRRACELWGIDREYWDIWGKKHVTDPEVQRSILRSLGVPTASHEELDEAVRERLWNEWSQHLPPAIVTGEDRDIQVSVPESVAGGEILVRLQLEDGSVYEHRQSLAEAVETGRAELPGGTFVRKKINLGDRIPHGYHTIEVSLDGGRSTSRLIACPDRTWVPEILEDGGRTAGVALSVYGIRSARNWGCGDLTDLRGIIDWMANSIGGSFLALNPLHAIPNRQPYNTSPYLPNCMYYRNPLYLDVEAIEDVTGTPRILDLIGSRRVQAQIEALRTSEYVEYELVYKLKLRFLRLAFSAFLKECAKDSPRAREFRDYVDSEGELLDNYAIYCALDEWIHARNPDIWIWPDWPEELRNPESSAVRDFARKYPIRVLFHKYLQWQLDIQLGAAQQYARECSLSIGLYHDLALATDRCGSDLWAHRPFYVSGCRVGSPPDDFSPKGQDWGFPPPNSEHHRTSGYRMFAESIRKNCRHGGALRIDHVMRFFRLFWIPDDKEAAEGTYVSEHWRDLLHILALESVRNKVIVVGEDLGTVEPSFREALSSFGIFSYRLLYFEKKGEDFKLPA
jgi:4-alpha-glucanotransferase